jgi:hypothetical protein
VRTRLNKIIAFLILVHIIIPISPAIAFDHEKESIACKKQEYFEFALKNGIEDSTKAEYLFLSQINIFNIKHFDKLGIDLNEFASQAGQQFVSSSLYLALRSEIIVSGKLVSKSYIQAPTSYYGTVYEMDVKETLYNPKDYDKIEKNKIYLFQLSGENSRVSSESKNGFTVGEEYLFYLTKQPILTVAKFIEQNVFGYENRTLPDDINQKNYFYPVAGTSNFKHVIVENKKLSYRAFRKKLKQLEKLNKQTNFFERNYKVSH